MTLLELAEAGRYDEVTERVEANDDVNALAEDGRVVLHEALAAGNADIVHLLLRRGADTSISDATGSRPLHWAIRSNDKAILEIVAGFAGFEVDAPDVGGRTALSWAAQTNAPVSIAWLL